MRYIEFGKQGVEEITIISRGVRYGSGDAAILLNMIIAASLLSPRTPRETSGMVGKSHLYVRFTAI